VHGHVWRLGKRILSGCNTDDGDEKHKKQRFFCRDRRFLFLPGPVLPVVRTRVCGLHFQAAGRRDAADAQCFISRGGHTCGHFFTKMALQCSKYIKQCLKTAFLTKKRGFTTFFHLILFQFETKNRCKGTF
jgi:hypothetical protein